TGVRVVPQQLVDGPLFDQRIRGRQQDHRRPAAAAAAAKLPDQQSAAAVQRRQNQPEQRLGKRDIAQQEFADERCQNEQSKCRAEPSYSAGDQPAALDPRERSKTRTRSTGMIATPGMGTGRPSSKDPRRRELREGWLDLSLLKRWRRAQLYSRRTEWTT